MSRPNKKSFSKDKEPEAKKVETVSENDKSDLKAYIKDESMIKILNKKGVTKLFPIQY